MPHENGLPDRLLREEPYVKQCYKVTKVNFVTLSW